jgi:hypothetical protein
MQCLERVIELSGGRENLDHLVEHILWSLDKRQRCELAKKLLEHFPHIRWLNRYISDDCDEA